MHHDAPLKRPGVFAQAAAIASRLLSLGRGAAWALPVRAATPLTLEAMRQGAASADPHCSPAGTYAVELSNGAQLSLTASRTPEDAPALHVVPGGKP